MTGGRRIYITYRHTCADCSDPACPGNSHGYVSRMVIPGGVLQRDVPIRRKRTGARFAKWRRLCVGAWPVEAKPERGKTLVDVAEDFLRGRSLVASDDSLPESYSWLEPKYKDGTTVRLECAHLEGFTLDELAEIRDRLIGRIGTHG